MSPMVISIEIPGKPLPKERPTVVNGRAFTRAGTRDAEMSAGFLMRHAMRGRPPIAGAVRVDMLFVGAHGSSDSDNLAKLILDAGNGILYVDDRQVSSLHVERRKAGPGDPARSEITVTELAGDLR